MESLRTVSTPLCHRRWHSLTFSLSLVNHPWTLPLLTPSAIPLPFSIILIFVAILYQDCKFSFVENLTVSAVCIRLHPGPKPRNQKMMAASTRRWRRWSQDWSLCFFNLNDICPLCRLLLPYLSHYYLCLLFPSTAAYKHADGKKIDNRRVLVDVERARTVKGWLPRRLGKSRLDCINFLGCHFLEKKDW